ncbi:MAG: fibronectin type III domain-containing protein [Phycisphaerae bacterium]|nr:fibronectin type III domain-containing protein [Phycisphaerae bacterium]
MFKCIIYGLCLVLTLDALADDPAQNVRVVWFSSPSTEAMVVWDSTKHDKSSELLYDTVSHGDQEAEYAFRKPVGESGPYTDIAKKRRAESDGEEAKRVPVSQDVFYYHTTIKNLEPETVYYVAVKTADGVGSEYHFKTAPVSDRPIKLIYGGDSRSRIETARAINIQISQMIAQDDSIVALLHGGDYAASPTRELWKDWLEAYALTTTKTRKLLPIIPVVGNHESPAKNPMFRQAYGYPGGPDDYFAFRLTPSVGLICLNTEISAEGEQKVFLRSALTDLEEHNVRWRIAAYHKPAYPAVKQPSVARVSWVPLFEAFNIDLVLESDGHCIKRTVPIRNGREASDGIVYLGEGGYGAPQRDPKPNLWYLKGDSAFASRGDHIMMLEITPNAINYSTILSTGEIIDAASFKARR